MSLTTPYILPISPFDATQPYTVQFSAIGGDQVTGNTLIIYNNNTNQVVYSDTITSLILSHTIPASILLNGTTYKCTIATINSLGQSSAPSFPVIIYPLTPCSIVINTIDASGKVYNQNVTFSATYSQAQSEILQQYEYQLYDSNKVLLQSFPVQYTSTNPLTQLITNLDNGIVKYVRVITLSLHGQTGDSGLIQFTPFYVSPLLNATLTAQNIPTTGTIHVSADIVQVLGTITKGSEVYTNSTWIDLTNSQVTFQSGFSISQDNFVLKLWCKNVPDDVVFLTLGSNTGYIDFIKSNNAIHILRHLQGCSVVAHFVSNTFIFATDVEFMLFADSIGGLMDVSVQTV